MKEWVRGATQLILFLTRRDAMPRVSLLRHSYQINGATPQENGVKGING